jgi:hypothetical protein
MYSNKYFYNYLNLVYNFLFSFKFINLYDLFLTIHLYLKQSLIYKRIIYKHKNKTNKKSLSMSKSKLIIKKNMLKKNDIVNVAKFDIFCEILIYYISIEDRVVKRRITRNWLTFERLKLQEYLVQFLLIFKHDVQMIRTYELPDFIRWSYDRFKLTHYDYDYNVLLNSKIVDILNNLNLDNSNLNSNLNDLEFFKTKFWQPLIKYRPKRGLVRNFFYPYTKKIKKKIKFFKKYIKLNIFFCSINNYIKYYYFNKDINNNNIQQLYFNNINKYINNIQTVIFKNKNFKNFSIINNNDVLYNFYFYSFILKKLNFEFQNVKLLYYFFKKKLKTFDSFDLKLFFNQTNENINLKKNNFKYDLKFYLDNNFIEDENLRVMSDIEIQQPLALYPTGIRKYEIVEIVMGKFTNEHLTRNSQVVKEKYFSKN